MFKYKLKIRHRLEQITKSTLIRTFAPKCRLEEPWFFFDKSENNYHKDNILASLGFLESVELNQ